MTASGYERPLYPASDPVCAAVQQRGEGSLGLLFDHVVGARKQSWGNVESEFFGRLEVDNQLELAWLQSWRLWV